MKILFSRFVLCLFMILVIVSSGLAQRQTGSISGQVVDDQKNSLPGVTVTLSGPAIMGTQTFVTTETGAFRFIALPPGRDFQLKATLPGFKTVIRTGLVINVGQTTTVELIMEPSPVSEEVTVVAASPVVDIQASKSKVTYTTELLLSLPVRRDLYDLQNSIPGAISEGLDYRRMSSILGGTLRDQLYALDGVPMNDPATNYSMANINVDVYEEVEFEVSGHPAEVGQVQSTYINIVTKSGGNKFSGGFVTYYTSDSLGQNLWSKEQLLALNANPPEKYSSYNDYSLSLGGPIIKDKIWFFLNGRRYLFGQQNRLNPEARMAALGFDSPHYNLDHQEWMGFGKLTFQITPKIKYTAMLHYNHIYEPIYQNSFGSDASFDNTRIWDHENTYTTMNQINWVPNQNTFVDIRAGYVHRFFPLHSRNEGAYTYYDSKQKVYWGTAGYNDEYVRKKTVASLSITRFQDDLLGASHEFKGGFEFEQDEYHRDWWRANPYYSYWYDYAARNPYYYSTTSHQGRLRIRICPDTKGQWDVQDHTRRFSGYLQDSAKVKRLTINGGVRLDYSYQYEPPQGRPELRYDYAPELLNPAYMTDPNYNPNILLETLINQIHETYGISPWDELHLTSTKKVVKFTTLSPRLGLVYDIFGNGKTAFKASFGRYYEPVWAAKYNSAQIFGASSFDFRWNDLNGNKLMDLPPVDSYSLTSYQEQDPNFNYFVSNLKCPYTDELTVGIDQQLLKDFRLGVQFLYKVNKNIVEDTDMYNGYDPTLTDDTGLVWLPFDATDPGWDGIFGTNDDQVITVYGLRADRPVPTFHGTNPPEAKRRYWATMLTFDKRMSNRWQLNGSILYSSFKGNCDPGYSATEGESTMFDNPNVLINAWGSTSYDRPLQIKIMGSYITPYDFIISAYFQYLSGSPWARTFERIYFPSGFGAQSTYASGIYTEPNGSRRLPPYTNMDMRIEKQFKLPKAVKFNIYVDIFNVFGRSGININEDPYARLYSYANPPYQTLSTTYKQITSVYGVRSVRFGARISF
jgi:hypothetical protein